MSLEEVEDREAQGLFGEAFHTSLRKGSDHPEAAIAHGAITRMPDDEWEEVVLYMMSGLAEMGYVLAKRVPFEPGGFQA